MLETSTVQNPRNGDSHVASTGTALVFFNGIAGWSLAAKILISMLIAAPLVLCLWFVDAFAVDVPIYDQWSCVAILSSLEKGDMNLVDVLFKQHNRHITGVPFVLMAVLAKVTGYDTRVEMFVGVGILFAAFVALALMARSRSSKGWPALLAVLPLAWLVMSVRQHEAILGGVMGGLEHMAVTSFLVLSVYFLDCTVALGWPLVFAMVAAACTVFSLANGFFVLPLGALQLALSGFAFRTMPRKTALLVNGAWAIFSVVVGGVYLYKYERSVDTSLWSYFADNVYSEIQFFLAFLGSPLNGTDEVGAAIATSLVVIGILAVVVLAIAFRAAKLDSKMVAPAMLLGYVLVSAALITLGRAHFGLEQATTSRYVCISYLGIASVYLILLSAHSLPVRGRAFLLTALLVLMAGGTVASVQDGLVWGGVRHYYRLSMANLLRNYKLQEHEALKKLGKKPEKVLWCSEFLEKNHWSVFRQQNPQELWNPSTAPAVALETISSRPSQMSNGIPVIVLNNPAQKNLSFTGWALDSAARGPAGGVVICVDETLEIPAAYGLDRPDIGAIWKRSRCLRSGFSVSLLTSAVGAGSHRISLKVLSPDKKRFYRTPTLAVLQIRETEPIKHGTEGTRKFVAGRISQNMI